jgi:hypothetical protein
MAPLWCQAGTAGEAHDKPTAVDEPRNAEDCSLPTQSFPLNDQDLTLINTGSGILFTAGMTIDADGAPNAYAPHNRGLDYTANARGAQGWIALVTNENGRPVIQENGPYRGYYVSTTSLAQGNVRDQRNPKRYIDARRVPYIALPPDFARTFGIHLGDGGKPGERSLRLRDLRGRWSEGKNWRGIDRAGQGAGDARQPAARWRRGRNNLPDFSRIGRARGKSRHRAQNQTLNRRAVSAVGWDAENAALPDCTVGSRQLKAQSPSFVILLGGLEIK